MRRNPAREWKTSALEAGFSQALAQQTTERLQKKGLETEADFSWRGTWLQVFMCANVSGKLGNLKPARPIRPLFRASPCLIHGFAYEADRDEGNEVPGQEGQGHEGNEGRSLGRGSALFQPLLYACFFKLAAAQLDSTHFPKYPLSALFCSTSHH